MSDDAENRLKRRIDRAHDRYLAERDPYKQPRKWRYYIELRRQLSDLLRQRKDRP